MEGTEVRKLAALEDAHWWYRERRHLLASALRGDDARARRSTSGAAGGGNTRVLRDLGWSAAALEYGEDGALVAAERGLPVMRADATLLPVADGALDLVVAFDVLEHLVDDDACAGEILRVLRPGGTFLVAVPCDPRLWSAHDEAVGHVRRYTRETLHRPAAPATGSRSSRSPRGTSCCAPSSPCGVAPAAAATSRTCPAGQPRAARGHHRRALPAGAPPARRHASRDRASSGLTSSES